MRVKNVHIPVPQDRPEGPRHLILTGRNGSGKSSILQAIAYALSGPTGKPVGYDITLDWCGDPSFAQNHKGPHEILTFFKAARTTQIRQAAGPKKHDINVTRQNVHTHFGESLLQVLVNKKTEQAYAIADDDHHHAEQINEWIKKVHNYFKVIFGDNKLEMIFDRKKYEFKFRHHDGHEFALADAADGHKAALEIFADLIVRQDRMLQEIGDFKSLHDIRGVVLIDEIETHLHIALQEVILKFLTDIFPNIQFIIATHSPAVLSSIPGAIIYDLEDNSHCLSEELIGIRYGSIMENRLGIQHDFDIDTGNKLDRLALLVSSENPTKEGHKKEIMKLACELSQQSHTLALEVLALQGWAQNNNQRD